MDKQNEYLLDVTSGIEDSSVSENANSAITSDSCISTPEPANVSCPETKLRTCPSNCSETSDPVKNTYTGDGPAAHLERIDEPLFVAGEPLFGDEFIYKAFRLKFGKEAADYYSKQFGWQVNSSA